MPETEEAMSLCEACKARGERTIIPPGKRLCEACLRAHGEAPPVEPACARVAWLQHEIANWQQGRLITPRVAERLLALYEPTDSAPRTRAAPDEDEWPDVSIPMTPGMVLLYLGGILILTAVIMVASDVWKDLGKEGRFALTFVPVAALYAVGAYLFRRDWTRRVAGTVLLFFACVTAPAVFFMAQDAWWPGLRGSEAALSIAALTLMLHAATLAFFRSPVLTVPYPFTFVWLVGAVGDACAGPRDDSTMLVALLLGGLALMGLAVFTRTRGRSTYAAVPDVVGTFTALIALAILGRAGHHATWEIVSVLACLGAIGASVYRKNQVYLIAGSLMLMVNILAVGFDVFADAVGLPITLLSCGILIIAAGYVVQRVRHEYILEDQ